MTARPANRAPGLSLCDDCGNMAFELDATADPARAAQLAAAAGVDLSRCLFGFGGPALARVCDVCGAAIIGEGQEVSLLHTRA